MSYKSENLDKLGETLYTQAEVAELLASGLNTVYRLLRDGEFPNAFRLGVGTKAPVRIPKADLDAFIERRKVGVPAAAVAASPQQAN